jgi:hypothetical protein
LVKSLSRSQSQTQQSQQEGHRVADEELNEDLILHCWNLEQQQIKKTIDFNREQGVKVPDGYIGYGYSEGTTLPIEIKQKKRWLAAVRHKKSGEYIIVSSLLSAGILSDSEVDLFQGQTFPRLELVSMSRVKTHDNNEFLVRQMRAVGLNTIGGVVSVFINGDCDYTHRVPISPTTINQDGVEIKILTVGSCEFSYGTISRLYTTPFTKENILATIEKYPPWIEDNGIQGKIQYYLKREGNNNPTTAQDLESFIGADFDELWEQRRSPPPSIHIDSKGLHNYLKQDAASKDKSAYQ